MQVPDLARLLRTEVHSADNRSLGRIGAVYVQEGASQPLLVAFPADQDNPRVVPLFGAELRADGLFLAYSAELVESGPTVDADAALSVGEIGSVLQHYSPPVRTDTDRPITERVTGTGDVAAGDADVRTIPPFPFIGDDDLPPIVVTRPGLSGPRG